MVKPVTECWLPVVGFEEFYDVSNFGRVRSVDRTLLLSSRWGRSFPRFYKGRILKQQKNFQRGYMTVTLSKNGNQTVHKVHHLVLEAHVGPRPIGLEALHANDIDDDNFLANLSWGTRSTNALDQVRNGNHHNANKTHCPKLHPYDEINTRIQSNGARRCRQCERERKHALFVQ